MLSMIRPNCLLQTPTCTRAEGTLQEQIVNITRPPSGARHPAARIIGPVAVETGDAPFDPPGRADEAGVLRDHEIQPAPVPIGDHGLGAAETPRNGLFSPGPQ